MAKAGQPVQNGMTHAKARLAAERGAANCWKVSPPMPPLRPDHRVGVCSVSRRTYLAATCLPPAGGRHPRGGGCRRAEDWRPGGLQPGGRHGVGLPGSRRWLRGPGPEEQRVLALRLQLSARTSAGREPHRLRPCQQPRAVCRCNGQHTHSQRRPKACPLSRALVCLASRRLRRTAPALCRAPS